MPQIRISGFVAAVTWPRDEREFCQAQKFCNTPRNLLQIKSSGVSSPPIRSSHPTQSVLGVIEDVTLLGLSEDVLVELARTWPLRPCGP